MATSIDCLRVYKELRARCYASLIIELALCLEQLFAADELENKVILGSGIYRDDDSQPWVLPTVAKVSVSLLQMPKGWCVCVAKELILRMNRPKSST